MVLCSRGTCGAAAVAGLSYDSAAMLVWVTDIHADALQPMFLCQRHIETLSAPLGWTILDERDGNPRLWTVTPINAAAPSRKRGRVRRQRAQSGRIIEFEELQLFELADTASSNIAPVASLDDARGISRMATASRMSPAKLLG